MDSSRSFKGISCLPSRNGEAAYVTPDRLSSARGSDLVGEILRGLRRGIADGNPPIGSNMPPLRTLAARLGVAVNTLRAAYDRLVHEGVLRAVPRSGYLVVRKPIGLEEEIHAAIGDLIAQYGHERVLSVIKSFPVQEKERP